MYSAAETLDSVAYKTIFWKTGLPKDVVVLRKGFTKVKAVLVSSDIKIQMKCFVSVSTLPTVYCIFIVTGLKKNSEDK
jgi:hypothetical protein